MEKRLYRNTEHKMLLGVCAGLAEYFNLDPTIIRVIWALLSLSGTGIVAYIVCALIIPEKPTGYIDAE